MKKRHIKHPFGAVISPEARILILGSVPSVKSVEHGFYYMHPQNRFWRVLGALLDENLYDMDVEGRKKVLIRRGIALYDSVEECDIEGSSDSAISNVIGVSLPSLICGTKIKKIFANGNASYKYALKFNPQYADMLTKLPSTSPANAALSLDDLTESWRVILDFFD